MQEDQYVPNPPLELARRCKLTSLDQLCDGGYYKIFNNPNVEMVHVKENPITEFTPTGIKTSDGKHHELDTVILATGFDAMDGNYMRVPINGRGGESLQDHWDKKGGPTAYIGMSVPNFPNWFMITGPLGAFANLPPVIDKQIEWITEIIDSELQREAGETKSVTGKPTVETRQQAEDDWIEGCQKLATGTLFTETNNWIFGTNVSRFLGLTPIKTFETPAYHTQQL